MNCWAEDLGGLHAHKCDALEGAGEHVQRRLGEIRSPHLLGPWFSASAAALRSLRCRSIHVRLDAAAEAAVDVLRAEGMNDSEAVRASLREAPARRRLRSTLREEAARLVAEPEDREEVNTIREQMADLAPPA